MLQPSSNPNPLGDRTSNSDTASGSSDDLTLLARIGQGDETGMEAIFKRYSGPVYSVALRVLHDSGQAEDVMQEIFLQLWRNPEAFVHGRGSLGAWLVVVARNRAIDVLRRRKPTDSVDDVVLASPCDISAEAERNGMMEKVRVILADLPEEQRKSLELAYFEGLSHSEIASRTGDPLGTVKTRIRLGLMSLRKALHV
jgi:RNA polymerase sigma-70 factor (ECF subfamily)